MTKCNLTYIQREQLLQMLAQIDAERTRIAENTAALYRRRAELMFAMELANPVQGGPRLVQ